MKLDLNKVVLSFGVIFYLAVFSGCSSTQHINFKIHTEPEGAHVIYKVDNYQWIYLGVTPLDTIEVLNEDHIEGNHSLTLKTMRCGYLEQEKEWSGNNLISENKSKGMIFWTPRLIKNEE